MQFTKVEAGASIGVGAPLFFGITIGASAVVGYGAVVTKNVLTGSTVIGNAAAVIDPKVHIAKADMQ